MADLIHGGDIYSLEGEGDVLDFSANINPLGLHEKIKMAASAAIDCCVHYPDPLCRKLKREIAVWEGVRAEEVVCGNGAADLIFRLVQAIKPKKALLFAPGFAEYENALKIYGCECDFITLQEGNGFLPAGGLEYITEKTDLFFLCNPNNPTGILLEPEWIRQAVERCLGCGTVLVIDECFIDFIPEPERYSAKCFLRSPNVVILKAFTKLFAMPGLRLGYALCRDRKLLDAVEACGQPWSVSVIAQNAGVAALQLDGYAEKTRTFISEERSRLAQALERFGCKVYPSMANYLFFRSDCGEDLAEFLRIQRILIRSCSNYRGLDKRYYRIAVRTQRENNVLIDALEQFFDYEEKRG